MKLYLNVSPARKSFKSQLGQANHLIITALVGLDAVERKIVKEIPPDIHAAWSPKDATASARRSRRLILDMALVRAVDALDVYIRKSNRKPFLIESIELQRRISGSGHSIYRKFKTITEFHSSLDPLLCALIDVMIVWRNRSAHEEADNKIENSVITTLKNQDERISAEFKGLNSGLLISNFEENIPPKFKEIASFINATHHFVSAFDKIQLRTCNPERYLKEHIWQLINRPLEQSSIIGKNCKARFQSIWGKDASERVGAVVRFLRSSGLSACPSSTGTPLMTFGDKLLDQVGNMKPSEAYEWTKST